MSAGATHRASAHGPAHRSHRRAAISPAAKGPEAPATPEEAAGGKQNQCDNDNAQHIEPLLSSGRISSLLTIIIIRMMLKSTLKNSCFIQNNLLRAFPRAGIQEVSYWNPDLPYFINDGVILPVGDGVALDPYHIGVPDDGSVDDGLILIHVANIARQIVLHGLSPGLMTAINHKTFCHLMRERNRDADIGSVDVLLREYDFPQRGQLLPVRFDLRLYLNKT